MIQTAKWFRQTMLLTAVVVITFMELLDSTIVNVSLPYIGGTLSVTSTEATWGISTYICANAITLLLVGYWERRYGSKRLLVTALQLFAVASAACATVPNISLFVLCRALQGAAGGVMQPIAYSMSLTLIGEQRRTLAIALLGIVSTLAPTLGPVVGGWLTDTVGWQTGFLINVPIAGAAAFVIIALGEQNGGAVPRISPAPGIVQVVPLVTSVCAFQLVVDKGGYYGWSSSGVMDALIVVGCTCLCIFAGVQWRSRQPLINIRSILTWDFLLGSALLFIQNCVLFAGVVLVPLILEKQRSFSSLDTGLWVLPRGLGAICGMLLSTRMLRIITSDVAITLAFLTVASSSVWLSQLPLDISFWALFTPQWIAGVASAIGFVATSQIVFTPVERHHLVDASALFSFIGNSGATIGVAAATVGLEVYTRQAYADAMVHDSMYGPALNTRLSALNLQLQSAANARSGIATLVSAVDRQAAFIAANHLHALMGMLLIAAAPLSLLPRLIASNWFKRYYKTKG